MSSYRRPSSSSVSNFRQILQQAGYTVTVRTTRGDDIRAACGQLTGDVADQTRRGARGKKRAANDVEKNFGSVDILTLANDRS